MEFHGGGWLEQRSNKRKKPLIWLIWELKWVGDSRYTDRNIYTSCNDKLKPFTSHGHDREPSCNYWIYEKRIVPDLTKPNEEFNYFNLRKCILEPDYMKQRHEHTEFFKE